MKTAADSEYDIAISFAGEDRSYASELSDACKALGMEVYIDEDRKLDQWGLSFLTEQRKVYSGYKTKHFIPLISKYYFSKPIPTDEFRSALMESTKRRYILPIKLDDSDVSTEYLHADMQYIKSSDFSVEAIAGQLKKLVDDTKSKAVDIDNQLKEDFELPAPKLTPDDYNKFEEAESLLGFIANRFNHELLKLKPYGYRFIVRHSQDDVKIRISKVNDTIYSLNVFHSNMSTNSLGFNHEESMSYSKSSHNGHIEPFFDRDKMTPSFKLQSFSSWQIDANLSKYEIIEFFWEELSHVLENHHG